MERNFYEILGVEESAEIKDIKSSYRKLAKKFHPDKNPDKNTAKEFREVNEAYTVLSDEKKRGEYDSARKSKEYTVRSTNTSYDWQDVFSSYWEEWFGDTQQVKGDDVNVLTRLTLEEFNSGCQKVIVGKEGKFQITIPPGSTPNSKLKIAEKGEYSLSGGERGDMIITLIPLKHKVFTLLKGQDLSMEVELSYPALVLGSKVLIETLDSKIKVAIPPNTDVGTSLKIPGQGIGEGDLYVKVKLYLPKTLNAEEKRLINRLDSCPNISKYLTRD